MPNRLNLKIFKLKLYIYLLGIIVMLGSLSPMASFLFETSSVVLCSSIDATITTTNKIPNISKHLFIIKIIIWLNS